MVSMSKNTKRKSASKISLIRLEPKARILNRARIKRDKESFFENLYDIFCEKSKKWAMMKMTMPIAKRCAVATSTKKCKLFS